MKKQDRVQEQKRRRRLIRKGLSKKTPSFFQTLWAFLKKKGFLNKGDSRPLSP